MVRLSGARLRTACALIAERVVGKAGSGHLGEITLHPHQLAAIARVRDVLARANGCLLAEDVGRGKTYVALAIAAEWRSPLVVAPASLRETWQLAMRRAGVSCRFVSHEALSAGRGPPGEFDGVIVDESHRFRNPATKRYARLAALSARSTLLMLSATPVQNAARDLAAQLALVIGRVAYSLSLAELAALVVRAGGTGGAGDASRPRAEPPQWVDTGADDQRVLDAVLALPPPPRALDAGDAGLLRTIALVRAWASSRATLELAIGRRARTLAAIEQCMLEGRRPTRAELRSWHGGDEAVQLGFASLLADAVVAGGDLDALSQAIAAERDALAALRSLLRAGPDVDDARVAALRRIRARHPGERVLVFTEYATTARRLYGALVPDGGAGLLTAGEARIASGGLSRAELLGRFAPIASGRTEAPMRERVSLLVATDLLSEGVNLQDASVVVHADLPWNPARLAQRTGRVRRPGGRDVVYSYLLAPPAGAEVLLRTEERLRAKLAVAGALLSARERVLPALTASAVAREHDRAQQAGAADEIGSAMERVTAWRRARAPAVAPTMPLVVGAAGGSRGWIALLSDGRLLAPPECSIYELLLGMRLEPRALGEAERHSALESARRALGGDLLERSCGRVRFGSPLRATVEQAVARTVARLPRHERAAALAQASELRARLDHPMPVGIELALVDLLRAPPTGSALIDALAAVLPTRRCADSAEEPVLRALIVIAPQTNAGPAVAG